MKINFTKTILELLNKNPSKTHLKFKSDIHIDNKIQDILNGLKIKSLLNYGTQTIVFLSECEKYVYKCCYKEDGTIINNLFNDNINLIKSFNANIMLPESILYENENWIIYKQKYCKPLTFINENILLFILDFHLTIQNSGYKFSDIFYKNFGIYNGSIYLYDFHNLDLFNNSNNNFIVLNMYLNIFKFYNLTNNSSTRISSVSVVESDFGKSIFNSVFHKYLKDIYDKKYENLSINIDNIKKYLNIPINYNANKFNYNFSTDDDIELYSIIKRTIDFVDPSIIYFKNNDNTDIFNYQIYINLLKQINKNIIFETDTTSLCKKYLIDNDIFTNDNLHKKTLRTLRTLYIGNKYFSKCDFGLLIDNNSKSLSKKNIYVIWTLSNTKVYFYNNIGFKEED
jgi:hypothetical protein